MSGGCCGASICLRNWRFQPTQRLSLTVDKNRGAAGWGSVDRGRGLEGGRDKEKGGF